jgi:hypothetical protein
MEKLRSSEEVYEHYLIQVGFLLKTPPGVRVSPGLACEHPGIPSHAAQQLRF